VNKVTLIGRLTKDPTGGENYQRFTLAVDRPYRKREEGQAELPTADFIPCVAFGKTGEFIAKYFKQGSKIAITGRIQTGSYTNKDGAKVYTTDVIVEEAEFVERKATGSQEEAKPQDSPVEGGGFMDIPDGIENDLPFK